MTRSAWTRSIRRATLAGLGMAMAGATTAQAQIVVSANDAKMTVVEGVNTPVRNPAPDTATVIDLSASPPKVLGEVRIPTSVIGPPQSVAISPDAAIALITASTKIDPADPTKTVADDRVSVIDLRASPPAVIATLHAGSGASGVSINRAGTLALVANRNDGTVSVFTIRGRDVTPAGTVDLGVPTAVLGHVVFAADGRKAFVTRNFDSFISVLSIEGTTVVDTKRDITAGLKPYGIEVSSKGNLAVVGNIGAGATGGADTVAVIDLSLDPPRAVHQLSVGPIAEGLALSGDGTYVAVTVMNGSNAAKSSPFFNDFGLLKILRLDGTTLAPVTEAKIGHWCQGTVWSRDGRTVLVQCMMEKSLSVFHFDGRRLTPAGSIPVSGGPAGIRAAQP